MNSIKQLVEKFGEEDLDAESATKSYFKLRVTWRYEVATTRSLFYLAKALSVKHVLRD